MNKVFISLRMKGRNMADIETDIEKAKETVKNQLGDDVEFINTIVEDKPPYDNNNQAIWYLGKSIQLLSQCDVLATPEGDSIVYNGVFIEREVAKRYGLTIIEY